MGAVNYRATIDGGIKISHGILTTVAVEVTPTLRKGRRVYIRAVADDTVCVQLQLQQDGLDVITTRWGEPADEPSWATGLRNLLEPTRRTT